MLFAIVSLISVIVFLCWISLLSLGLAESLVKKWAKENDYELIEQRHILWWHPFKWRVALNPRCHVFRIVVRDTHGIGNIREGWIRIPSGLFKVNVVWDA